MTFEALSESELELLLGIMASGTTSPDVLPALVYQGGNLSLSNRLRAMEYDDIDRLWLRLLDILYPESPTQALKRAL